MQRQEHDVVAAVENRLAAVAVMKIDIEQRHTRRALVEERLRRDRGVVDETVAAEQACRGVMAGRPAQRESLAGAVGKRGLRAQRNVGAGARGFPGAAGNRGFCGHRVMPELAFDMPGHALLLHAACRPAIRYGFALVAGRGPVLPAGFEKTDEVRVVDAGKRIDAELARRDDFAEPDLANAGEHVLGAYRAFERRYQPAAVEFARGIAQGVFFAIDGEHSQSPVEGR